MKDKKYLFLLLLLVSLLSISIASAADADGTDMASADIDDDLVLEEIPDEISSMEQANENDLVYGEGLREDESEPGSITDLKSLFTDDLKEIKLDKNYVYDPEKDENSGGEVKIETDDFVMDGQGHYIDAGGKSRVFSVISNNVTIKNVKLVNAYSDFGGGAIFFYRGGTVENCTFINNRADGNGGAVYIQENANEDIGIVRDSTFIHNKGWSRGGALAFGGNSTVENCVFKDNNANYFGGAIGAIRMTIRNCTFENNSAGEEGGAVYDDYMTMESCVFNNSYGPHHGGAIYSYHHASIKNCSFSHSYASSEGGTIYFHTTGGIDGCNFTNNSVGARAAGPYFEDAETGGVVNNSIFIDNAAGYDTAIFFTYAGIMENTVLLRNKASFAPYNKKLFPENDGDNLKIRIEHNNERFNAMGSVNMKASNITYWNGEVVNSNDVPHISWTYPGMTIVVEVYDSNDNLVDNVTLLTKTDSKAYYNTFHLDDGTYTYKTYHPDDSYCTYVEATGSFTLSRNSSSVKITNNDDEIYYDNSKITFDVMNRTNITVIVRNAQGDILVNQSADDDYFILTLLPIDDYYNVTVYNAGNKTVSPSQDSKLFKVLKSKSAIRINYIKDYEYGKNVNIKLEGDRLTIVNVSIYDWDDNLVFSQNTTETTIPMPLLNQGRYYINVTNYGNETVGESRNTTRFKVIPRYNIAAISYVENVLYGEASIITITVGIPENYTLDINGNSMIIEINGSKTIPLYLKPGTYYANISLENENYNTTSFNKEFKVLNLKLETEDVEYKGEDKSYEYQAKLIDEEGNPISDKELYFKINNKTYNASTDDKGIARIGFSLNPGTYEMTVQYLGTDGKIKLQTVAEVHVSKIKTKLNAKGISTSYKSDEFLVISLLDSKGNPIPNAGITVNIPSKKRFITDKEGKVKIALKTLSPGSYKVNITYAGDETYEKSSTSTAITIKKASTNINVLSLKSSSSTFTFTLKNYAGEILKNQKVKLKVKGKTYTAKTNSKGVAKFKVKKLRKKGTYKAIVKYAGSKYYKESSKKVKLTVKAKFKTIARGSKLKTTVKKIQRALKKNGYYQRYNKMYLKVDGIFGVHTEKAVKQFQKAKGLKVTGKVNYKTAKKLKII